MGYEDRYDAMCDYNAEQQSEGRAEAVSEIIEHFKNHRRELWFTKEIIEELEGFE